MGSHDSSEASLRPPLEPMSMASAFSADVHFGQDYNAATLSFLPSFLAKTMDPSKPETDYAPVSIPALGPSMCEDLPDRFLCPDRALRYYLKLKHKGQYLQTWAHCVPSNLGTLEIYPSRRCQGGSGN